MNPQKFHTPCPASIEETVRYITSKSLDDIDLSWPPNIFGICTYLLTKSGYYIRVVQNWPPTDFKSTQDYTSALQEIGEQWSTSFENHNIPSKITQWWKIISENRNTDLNSCTANNDNVCETLLLLCAAADQASTGIGVPDNESDYSIFRRNIRASTLLRDYQTLSPEIRKEVCRVFPKQHTPQNGITVRSLSHNLSFIWGSDVTPHWHYSPHFSINERDHSSLNLLVIPYPFKVTADNFDIAHLHEQPLRNLDEKFGFFEYKSTSTETTIEKDILPLIRIAKKKLGRIDGIILPELSLDARRFNELWEHLKTLLPNAFLSGGVGFSESENRLGNNVVRAHFPMIGDFGALTFDQAKHHRWKLTESQIRQYDLCHRLDPFKDWWESIDVKSRQLHFFAIAPWLTLCFLICEDLARQDPVSQIVRSIGPNLIISLLMDGPQLSNRWSNRYATVFADDPGSSVLSITSLGMSLRSRPIGRTGGSRVIALWKEPDQPAQEIALDPEAKAAVLVINRKYSEEWSADGRGDGMVSGRLSLGGIHQILLDSRA